MLHLENVDLRSTLGTSKHGWENNIKVDRKARMYERLKCVHFVTVGLEWQAVETRTKHLIWTKV